MSVLSKPEILKHYKAGNVVIDPFNEVNLASSSYDVRLGKFFYRQNRHMEHTETMNPFWQNSVSKMYRRLEEAVDVGEVKSRINPFYNLSRKDKIILINPNETILAHTIEFIGGRNGVNNMSAITSEMRARSSLGRIGIAVCKCAGWGDVGYVNRWTMEITNFSSVIIPLVVGMRVAQIIFHEVTRVDEKDIYATRGKYQTDLDIKKIKNGWKPEMMLPQLYNDKDIGSFRKYWNK
ncbi:MAG: hypothetical protein COY04_01040 [Parcubacteria group bacterium CG_4_10_14_0_2_um_filter_7_35_8]|nr:MAG: hypothetical protein COX42_01800 [Parcubacteria group bacterium CG23_combo_of_CG06-09_8_20_14_all_35_6]PIZ76849.1 MAG: hypothetical protein COY04_01040 [Parcubacteria group bacterium CG_4_10_14_0_2_um_filter_7_35_8]